MDTYLPSDFHLLHDDAVADWRDLPAGRVNPSESKRPYFDRFASASMSPDRVGADWMGSDRISAHRIGSDSQRDIELSVDPTWLAI